jgi:hypothetical protein
MQEELLPQVSPLDLRLAGNVHLSCSYVCKSVFTRFAWLTLWLWFHFPVTPGTKSWNSRPFLTFPCITRFFMLSSYPVIPFMISSVPFLFLFGI